MDKMPRINLWKSVVELVKTLIFSKNKNDIMSITLQKAEQIILYICIDNIIIKLFCENVYFRWINGNGAKSIY